MTVMRFSTSSFLLLLIASLCSTPNCRGASPGVRGRKPPKIPGLPGTPRIPDSPSTPGIPGWTWPGNPGIPDSPGTPGIPDSPGTPGIPDWTWPGNPGIPDSPGTPGIPGWTWPGTPEKPDSPDTPEIPDSPGTPEIPGWPYWKVPPSSGGTSWGPPSGGGGCGCWCSSSSYNAPPPPPSPPPPSKTILVGGKNKWNFGFNYTDWAIKVGPLYVGDVLEFDYLLPVSGRPFNHSVVLLKDEESFKSCNLSGSVKIANEYAGGTLGGFKFMLGMKPPYLDQNFYIACGEKNGFHCDKGGMKFSVLPILRLG